MEIIKKIHNQLKDLNRNVSRIGASISRAVQEGIEKNDVRSGLLTLTTMEQILNDLSEQMMNKIDEKFIAASSLLAPTIDDELGSYIATGEGKIFQMDKDCRQKISENGRQYYVYVNQGLFCDVP